MASVATVPWRPRFRHSSSPGSPAQAGDHAVLEQRVAADQGDHQARFELALALYADGRNEEAVDALVEIVRRNRAWNDEAARKQLLQFFEALGPDGSRDRRGATQAFLCPVLLMANPFDPAFEDLPDVVPIFPLPGVLLLPGGRLPLNIFEPRYLNMTVAALAAPLRLIGMIQPQDGASGDHPEVYATGCVGRMISFGETEDGRYLITLKGVARFRVMDELPLCDGYRCVRASYAEFRNDLGRALPGRLRSTGPGCCAPCGPISPLSRHRGWRRTGMRSRIPRNRA